MKLRISESSNTKDVKNLYVAEDRNELKKYMNKVVKEFTEDGIIPTLNQIYNRISKDHDFVSRKEAEKENKKGVEVVSGEKIAKNIQNLCSFNLDDLDEAVEYTDTIDAIKDTLQRQFPELIVSIMNKPKRAVRVESEKILDDGNTLFNEVFYIFEGSDGRIKAIREHDRPVVFVDIEGIVNFFEDYLNS